MWVTTPAGQKRRKYVYGKTREAVYGKWVQLKAKAAKAPVPTSTPTVAGYLAYWLARSSGRTGKTARTRTMS